MVWIMNLLLKLNPSKLRMTAASDINSMLASSRGLICSLQVDGHGVLFEGFVLSIEFAQSKRNAICRLPHVPTTCWKIGCVSIAAFAMDFGASAFTTTNACVSARFAFAFDFNRCVANHVLALQLLQVNLRRDPNTASGLDRCEDSHLHCSKVL